MRTARFESLPYFSWSVRLLVRIPSDFEPNAYFGVFGKGSETRRLVHQRPIDYRVLTLDGAELP